MYEGLDTWLTSKRLHLRWRRDADPGANVYAGVVKTMFASSRIRS